MTTQFIMEIRGNEYVALAHVDRVDEIIVT
jgi:hypothetical protein